VRSNERNNGTMNGSKNALTIANLHCPAEATGNIRYFVSFEPRIEG
jgi:hypothetical protein